MYQVLYRKYRPKVFEDVIGQEQVTKTLQNELKLNRINHAYLFTGTRGTGKTTCAKIFAKAVNCLSLSDNGDPCCECEICKGIDTGEVLDVVEMDAASNRGIEDIRSIIDEVTFSPQKARYRVYIIDEVHMLTKEAFNALLKTLEEPPSHVIFILATTEVHKLLPTIISRCQRFDFHRISPNDICKRLKFIADKEGISLSDEAATLISVICDGAMRDAISLLDRCIAISDDVTASTVQTAAGLASKNHLFELCNCTINKNPAKALSIIDKLYSQSKDMSKLCEELISHFRALMMLKTVSDARSLLAFSDKEFDAAVSQSDYLSLADIIYCMDVLSRSFERMGKGISDRTELETALIKLCAPELDATNEALVDRVASLEKAVRTLSAGVVESKPQPQISSIVDDEEEEITASNVVEEVQEEDTVSKTETVDDVENETEEELPVVPKDNSFAEQKQEDKQEVIEEKKPVEPPVANEKAKVDTDSLYDNAEPFLQWPEVLNNLRRYSRAISAAFEGTKAYVSGGYILIDTEQEIAFKLLKQPMRRDDIRKAILETTGKTFKLGPYRPKKQEEKKDDVMSDFIQKLKDSGISVSEEEE